MSVFDFLPKGSFQKLDPETQNEILEEAQEEGTERKRNNKLFKVLLYGYLTFVLVFFTPSFYDVFRTGGFSVFCETLLLFIFRSAILPASFMIILGFIGITQSEILSFNRDKAVPVVTGFMFDSTDVTGVAAKILGILSLLVGIVLFFASFVLPYFLIKGQ